MCSTHCSFEKCSNNPAIICNCEAIPVLICEKHIKNHSQLPRSHTYSKVFSEIQEEARKSAIKLFSKIKPELKKLRSNIIQEKSLMIKEIHKVSQNALEEINNCEKNLNEIILEISSLKMIDNSKSLTFVESLLKQQNIVKIERIRSPSLSIKSVNPNFFTKIFNLEPSSECFDYRKNYYDRTRIIKFVWGNSGSLIFGVFDAETLRVHQHKFECNYDLNSYGLKCLLPDGSIFYSLNKISAIIDLNGNIKPIYPYKNTSIMAAIYVGGCIFASCVGSQSWMKYSIQSDKWSALIPTPKNQGTCTTCALFENYILLGSDNSTKIIYYDMLIESFSEIPSLTLMYSVKKIIAVQDRRAFIIVFSQFIYESTDTLITWNIIGNCSNLMPFSPITSYPIFYKENIYFSSLYGIYAFDTKEKDIKTVVNIHFY